MSRQNSGRKEKRVAVDGEADEIDPAWWSDAFGAEVHDYEPPERLSFAFQRLLEESNLGETQRQVLEVLAAATSAMLNTGDWLQPFRCSGPWSGSCLCLRVGPPHRCCSQK
jgi:hypothetical protein